MTTNDLANNPLFLEKSKNYNFTIYDFHQAKREAYLKRLVKFLGGKVSGVW